MDAVREAGHQQRVHQLIEGAHGQRAAVEEGARAADGREQLPARRVVDRAHHHLPVHLEGERGAEDRQAVRVVVGAVERVEHPAVARANRLVAAELLGDDLVVREPLGDELAEHALAGEVHLGHQVDLALLPDLQVRSDMVELDLPGGQHGFDGSGVEPGVDRLSGWGYGSLAHRLSAIGFRLSAGAEAPCYNCYRLSAFGYRQARG